MRTQFRKRLHALCLLALVSACAQADHSLEVTLLKPMEGANDLHLVFRDPGFTSYYHLPKGLADHLKVKQTGPFGDKLDLYWNDKIDLIHVMDFGTLTFTVSHPNHLPEIISGYWTSHDPKKPYDPEKADNIGVIDLKDVKVRALPVPEPATMVVLGLGLLALGRRRKGA